MQPIYLLDTNIISEILMVIPNQKVVEKIQENKNLSCISSVGFEELLYGAKRLETGKKQNELMSFLIDYVQANFEVIAFDIHASWINSDIRERLERIGKKAPSADSMIAATAIANNMVLVTRNVKDFDSIREVSSLMVENWFED